MQSSTLGQVNFMAEGSKSSLYRNGEVLIRRDATGDAANYSGVEVDKCLIKVIAARHLY